MLKSIVRLKKNLIKKAEESRYQYTIYGTFSLFGFLGFYFANSALLAPGQYENFYIRWPAIILSFFLIIESYWPARFKKLRPIYWYVTITYNLPFFFTYMLLQNKWSVEWQLNELMALTVLVVLTDITSLFIVAPIGIIVAFIFYYIFGTHFFLPDNITSITVSYATIVIFCAIFNHKKDRFYLERLKFQSEINRLNNSLEQKVSKRTFELEQALLAKTEFLNNMSHEIRTPIQGFTNISEGLVEYWNDFGEDKKLDLARQVSVNAKRLAKLVGHLLDLSKFSAGKMILHSGDMDLNDAVLSMIDECEQLYLTDKKITFNFKKTKDTKILADSERITQVLRNLFVNAIKFSPDGSSISIQISKTTDDNGSNFLLFNIEDGGIGIPEEELESIFLPFVISSKTKTKSGGTGLGLAIAREIIEAHQGKIWAKNNEKGGATFSFLLPIKINSSRSRIKIIDKKPTILMVDDEESCLISMEMLLYGSGYEVIKASGGVEALNYLRNNPNEVDLILLDLMMPDMYGLNVLEEIKKDEDLQNIKIILQTGSSDEEEIDKAYRLGVISHISKPYDKKVILDLLARSGL